MPKKYQKEINCAECGEPFISNNINTRRCDKCKEKSGSKVRSKWTRDCCICGNEFTTQNIYTVSCSTACGRKAADSGVAQEAKARIKAANQKVRDDREKLKAERAAKRITADSLLSKMKDAWPDYDYELLEEPAYSTKVLVRCEKHGESTYTHYSQRYPKSPCLRCRTHHNLMTHKEWIAKAREKFGDRYIYLSRYEPGDSGKVTFICPDHGKQTIGAKRHLRSETGCSACSKENMDYARSKGCYNWTTLLRDEELANTPYFVYVGYANGYQKVGLTKHGENSKRLRALRQQGGFDSFKIIHKGPLIECFDLEQLIIEEAENFTPDEKFGGHTECFTSQLINLVRGVHA